MTTIDSICLVLFVLGFIGNLLGLFVFSSRRFRCCSTYTVLALTSFSINLICIIRYSLLLHSTTRRWLSDKIVSSHWLSCKIFRLSSSFRVLAAWVTVYWVIERFVYVTSRLHLLFHHRERFRCVERFKFLWMIVIALIMVFVVTGPTVVFSSPNVASSSMNSTNFTVQCTFDPERTSAMWQNYFDDLSFGFNYHTIRSLLSELIPSLLVAVFNIGIVASILCTTAQVRRRQQFNHQHPLTLTLVTGSISKVPGSSPLHLDRSQQSQRQSSFKQSAAITTSVPFGKMSWMNVILLLHSLLFFLSSSVTSLVYFSTSDIILAHWVSVIILANCSLNFYVYCLSGSQFRREFKRIVKSYVRHLRKAWGRNSGSSVRDARSPKPTLKTNIYHPVHYIKQPYAAVPPLVRSNKRTVNI